MKRYETEINPKLSRKGSFDLQVFTLTAFGVLDNGTITSDDNQIDAIALGFLSGKIEYQRKQVFSIGPTTAPHCLNNFYSSDLYQNGKNRDFLYSWSSNPARTSLDKQLNLP